MIHRTSFWMLWLFLIGVSMACVQSNLRSDPSPPVQLAVTPSPYERAIRNPMMGFTTMGANLRGSSRHPWASTHHIYIKWSELEDDAADGIAKILDLSNRKFKGLAEQNKKAIVRVYLDWGGKDRQYWPSDMTAGDYESPQFKERVVRLIEKMGIAWDTDPRIAFVEMGIIGKWGEQHSPSVSVEMQKILGDAFSRAFPNKKVSVRKNWASFTEYPFGVYWDSWGHYDQMGRHGKKIAALNQSEQRHLVNYVGGEVAYNWGQWKRQPGENPTQSVSVAKHRDFIMNTIRWLHATQLRWIANYDQNDPEAALGAEAIQKVFGYRFILNEVRVSMGERLSVSFDVTNEGSAPFYYNWPVEVALLEPATLEPVWRSTFQTADIRTWHPGSEWTEPEWTDAGRWKEYVANEDWNSSGDTEWAHPPEMNTVEGDFKVDLPAGFYLLSLAILDPAGSRPSLRFATANYIQGGHHPIALVNPARQQTRPLPADFPFDDRLVDTSLSYEVEIDEERALAAYQALPPLKISSLAKRAAEEFIILTDRRNRSIDLELLRVEEGALQGRRRSDLQMVEIPVEMLCDEDQAFAAYLWETRKP